jgi:hypothetical protein
MYAKLIWNHTIIIGVNLSRAIFYANEDVRPTYSALYLRIDRNALAILLSPSTR